MPAKKKPYITPKLTPIKPDTTGLALTSIARSMETIAKSLSVWVHLQDERFNKDYPPEPEVREATVGTAEYGNPEKKAKKRKTKRHRGSAPAKSASTIKSRNDRRDALRRAGIEDPAEVESLPRVSSILRFARGGLGTVLTWLRASVDEDARKFVGKYDAIRPRDRRYVRWEEIAFAAGLDPFRLLEVAVSTLVRNGETVGQIISATSHPMIVRKSVEMALTDGGFNDRKSLLSARGFLPVPKGTTIYNRIDVANVNAQEIEKSELPSMEDDLRDIHGLLIGQGNVR